MALVAWYPLNGDTLDYSGDGNHGTNHGAVVSDEGKIGKCYSFNTSYLTSENKLVQGTDFSVSLWVKTSSTANQCLFCTRTIVGNGVSLFMLNSNNIRFDTDTSTQWLTGYTVPLNTWVHVTVTKSNKYKKLYINGVLYASTSEVGDMTTLSNIFSIGASHSNGTAWGNYFKGNVNDVRVYDHTLSEKEIREISKAKILHYTFDDFQEPTTNLAPYTDYSNRTYNSKYIASSWGGDVADVYYYSSGGYNNLPYKKMIKITGGTGGSYVDDHQTFTITTGKTYTVSCYMKASRTVTLNAYSLSLNRSSDNTYITGISPTLTIDWQRFYFTFTATITGSFCVRQIIYDDVDLPLTIYWCGMQVEEKDHVTPFVNGTRTGKVKDISGYNNDAQLDLTTTPQWTEDSKIGSGAYKFNGTQNITTSQIFFDNVNQCHTVSAWIFPTNPSIIGNQQLLNFNSGYRLYHTANGQSLMYMNSGANDHYVYGSIIPANKWTMVTWVYDKANLICRVYYDGNLNASSSNFTSSDIPKGFSTSTIFGSNFVGLIDDVRIYATALSDADIKELYQTRASLDDNGNLHTNQIIENIEPTENLFDFNVLERCWNGGSSNVCSLREIKDSHSVSLKGQADVISDSGYAYIYPYFDTTNEIHTISATVKNNNTKQLRVGIRCRDGNNGDDLATSTLFQIGAKEIKRIANVSHSPVTQNRVTVGLSVYTDEDGYIDCDIYDIQLEAKDHATPFTDSIRLQSDNLPVDFLYGTNSIMNNGIGNFKSVSEVGITDGLIAYYPLDGNANDYSGNQNHGTLIGTPIQIRGVKNSGYNFKASGDKITVPNITAPTLTLCAWHKWDDTSTTWRTLFGNNANYHHMIFNSNKVLSLWDGSQKTYGYTLSDSNWHYYVVVINSSTNALLYVDGVYSGETATTLNLSTYPVQNIGNWGNSTYPAGNMDDVRIYNRALSPEEIAIQYDLTKENYTKMKITADTLYVSNQLKEV